MHSLLHYFHHIFGPMIQTILIPELQVSYEDLLQFVQSMAMDSMASDETKVDIVRLVRP